MLHPDEAIKHRLIISELLGVNRNKVSNSLFLFMVNAHSIAVELWLSVPLIKCLTTECHGLFSVKRPLHDFFDKV